jgi:aquaporin Z
LGGKISGGNFNPAVSVMMAVAGKLPIQDLAGYISAQILGGLAAFVLYSQLGKLKK